jgi:hypothetical protein
MQLRSITKLLSGSEEKSICMTADALSGLKHLRTWKLEVESISLIPYVGRVIRSLKRSFIGWVDARLRKGGKLKALKALRQNIEYVTRRNNNLRIEPQSAIQIAV